MRLEAKELVQLFSKWDSACPTKSRFCASRFLGGGKRRGVAEILPFFVSDEG